MPTSNQLIERSCTLATASVPLTEVGPADVLSHGHGRPRGFWGHGDAWAAWIDVAGALEVLGTTEAADGTPVCPCSGAAAPADYVARVRSAAPCLLGPADAAETGARPRLYGGFAFRGDHVAVGGWSDFPAGSFVLPRLEARGGPDGVVLIWSQIVRDGGPDVDAAGEAARAAEALREHARLRAGRATSDPESARTGAPADARPAWEAAVRRALDAIEAGTFSKVVLARVLDVELPDAVDAADVVERLRRENPQAHVFLYAPQGGPAFLGAAPEVVASVAGAGFRATAVAGSIERGAGAAEDERLAAELLGSAKDRAEHAVVVEDMLRRLGEHAETLDADETPRILRLRSIQHLETVITARLSRPLHVLTLLESVHPTPAVCGDPRDAALAFLRAEEPFERGWYAGPVGWFDAHGNGTFAPALRSAVGQGRAWRLYAGAGIVRGSRPDAEWEETRIKFEPMLRGLGVTE